jgi:hypothetical protein
MRGRGGLRRPCVRRRPTGSSGPQHDRFFCFFFSRVTGPGPRRSLVIQKSMSLKYKPASLPQHIYVKWSFLRRVATAVRAEAGPQPDRFFCFFFFTLVTGPRRSMSLDLSDKKTMSLKYKPAVTTAHFCEMVVLKAGCDSCACRGGAAARQVDQLKPATCTLNPAPCTLQSQP